MAYEQSTRDLINKDDLNGIRNLNIKWDENHVRYAVVAGSMNVLKYFIDEKKVVPCPKGITYAFIEAKLDLFYYLARKNFKHQIVLPWIFDDCRFYRKEIHSEYDSVNVQEFEDIFQVKINSDTSVTMKIRLIVALCNSLLYRVTGEDLWFLIIANKFHSFSPTDFYFLIQNTNIDKESILARHVGFMYGYDIDITLPIVQKLSSHFTSPLTNEIIKEISFDGDDKQKVYDTAIRNVKYHIENYGMHFDDEFPFFKFNNKFESILAVLNIPSDIWYVWLFHCINGPQFGNSSIYHLKLLLTYHALFIENLSESQKQKLFIFVLTRRISRELIDLLLKTFPSLSQNKWLEWTTIVRIIGLSDSEYLEEKIDESYPDICSLIDFDVKLPEQKEERWAWYGIGGIDEGTYVRIDYAHNIEILDEFKNIKTISDISSNISKLSKRIRSPTDCYFDVNDSEVFYKDSQGCILWALEEHTGRVYIYDEDNMFTRTFVAKSLPEFLSRIMFESSKFYTKYYSNLN